MASDGAQRTASMLCSKTSNVFQECEENAYLLQALVQSGVTKYLIIGLDKEIVAYLTSKGLNVHYHKVRIYPQLEKLLPAGRMQKCLETLKSPQCALLGLGYPLAPCVDSAKDLCSSDTLAVCVD